MRTAIGQEGRKARQQEGRRFKRQTGSPAKRPVPILIVTSAMGPGIVVCTEAWGLTMHHCRLQAAHLTCANTDLRAHDHDAGRAPVLTRRVALCVLSFLILGVILFFLVKMTCSM